MDRRAQVVAVVNASQEAALAAHDAKLANAVDNLPIGNLTLHPSAAEPPSPGADTLFSRTKKLMFHLKDIESDLMSACKASGNRRCSPPTRQQYSIV